MLAQALAEGHPLAGDEKAAALAAARVQRCGRWECTPAPVSPEPLAASSAHWDPGSAMLFEPTEVVGLGIRPSSALLQAGVVAAEHLSARARVWMWKYSEARVRHPMLPSTKAGKEEWERVLREVVAMRLEAPAATSTATGRDTRSCWGSCCMRGAARGQQRSRGERRGEQRRWSSTRRRRRAC